eukprot:scaffold2295_cov354-Prasinococcus_capsulatus_cf.AAC.10
MASPGALGGLARRCTASIARRGGAGLKVDMRPPPSQKVRALALLLLLLLPLVGAINVAVLSDEGPTLRVCVRVSFCRVVRGVSWWRRTSSRGTTGAPRRSRRWTSTSMARGRRSASSRWASASSARWATRRRTCTSATPRRSPSRRAPRSSRSSAASAWCPPPSRSPTATSRLEARQGAATEAKPPSVSSASSAITRRALRHHQSILPSLFAGLRARPPRSRSARRARVRVRHAAALRWCRPPPPPPPPREGGPTASVSPVAAADPKQRAGGGPQRGTGRRIGVPNRMMLLTACACHPAARRAPLAAVRRPLGGGGGDRTDARWHGAVGLLGRSEAIQEARAGTARRGTAHLAA